MSNCATCNTATFIFLLLIATHFATRIYLSSAKETQQKLAEYLVGFKGFGQISLDCPMSRQTGWIPMLGGCPSQSSENKVSSLLHTKEQCNDSTDRFEIDGSTEAHSDVANPTTPQQVGKTLVGAGRVGTGTASGHDIRTQTLSLCRSKRHWTTHPS
jgi:hypothetical protein